MGSLRSDVLRRLLVSARRLRAGRVPTRRSLGWALRLTAAAVLSFVAARALLGTPQPLLAPLTALLVIQVTPVSLLSSGVDRVVSVVAGVLLATAFAAVVPLAWWSLGVLIALSILLGQALRLRDNLIEVAISGMLVLGVGSFAVESAAWERITETLVGAGVGVAANLLFPPRVATGDAAEAIRELADREGRMLRRAADDVAAAGGRRDDVADRAADWLDEARVINHDMPGVGAALLRAEESRRLNVRALGTRNAAPGLRQGLESLEHTAVTLRGMVRAVHDATRDEGWPGGDAADLALANVHATLEALAGGVEAFGELVRNEALSRDLSADEEVRRVGGALEELHEVRARLSDAVTVPTGPVVTELHLALLTTVKRVLQELDLEHRVRRQEALRPTRQRPLPLRRPPRN